MANLITVGRVLLLFVAIAMLYSQNAWVIIAAGFLIAGIFAGDGLDGWVARRRGSTSKLGAVLDIAGDRVVENALWVVFAELHLVGVWAPLVVLTRSFVVDVLRSVALTAGKTAFGEATMARSRITWFLTASRFSRSVYGYSKALGFCFLAGLLAWNLPGAEVRVLDWFYDFQGFRTVGWLLVYASIVFCVLRGLPVIYDAMYYLRDDEPATEAPVRGAVEHGERA